MKLGKLFSDGVVLQRDTYIPVWGDATPGTLISAEIAGHKAFTRTSLTGKFLLRLAPLPAGGPYELLVTNRDSGDFVSVKDVLIGEVWIASGQSNMQYHLGDDWAFGDISPEERVAGINRKQEKEYCEMVCDPEKFRAIDVPMVASGVRQETFDGSWKNMNAENAKDFSAVALWFGYYLRKKLNVSVGIICSAWGGTIAEAWTSRVGLLSNPDTVHMVMNTDDFYTEETVWKSAVTEEFSFEKITQKDPGNEGFGKGWASPEFNDFDWSEMMVPGSWIQQKIAGNGSVWIRRTVNIPASWGGKDLILKTGGIDKHDITYFNGQEIGRTGKEFETDSWSAPRQYRIPANLVKPGCNTIAIRAYSFIYDGSFNGAPERYQLCLSDSQENIEIAGVWKASAEFDMGVIPVPNSTCKPGPGNPNSPSILFDGMINPLIPFAIRGAIWYQGESNANTMEEASLYRRKLKTMIQDWRYHWGQGDFPFIQVQLANFREPKVFDLEAAWPILRESQRLLCTDLPNVFMASAIDVGDAVDIHPQDKQSVGFRLAQVALHESYHAADVVPFGPLYKDFSCEGERIRVSFKNAEGLHFRNGKPDGFYLSGPNKKFYCVDDAEIVGDSILLRSENVKNPCAVRYAWADNPNGSLYNGANLPASSFRTDTWEYKLS